MQARGVQEAAKKALATLDREWDGLIAHRGYPMISLDNNAAERQLRGPVVTRKTAGGSHNRQTAGDAAQFWSGTATAQKAALNLITHPTAYLHGYCPNPGPPPSGRAPEQCAAR